MLPETVQNGWSTGAAGRAAETAFGVEVVAVLAVAVLPATGVVAVLAALAVWPVAWEVGSAAGVEVVPCPVEIVLAVVADDWLELGWSAGAPPAFAAGVAAEAPDAEAGVAVEAGAGAAAGVAVVEESAGGSAGAAAEVAGDAAARAATAAGAVVLGDSVD